MKTKTAEKQEISRKFNRRLRIIGICLLVVAIVIGELILGNIPYYLKWSACGGQPILVTHTSPFGFGYVPQTYTAKLHPGFFDSKASTDGPILYCSLDEAKQKIQHDIQIQN